ncbi:MAG: AEC family transporter [Minwuia sp.]|nr:AEC family transporter [Minwuia sp.]
MGAVIDIVFPVFALIAIGYALGRSPLLGGDVGIKALTNFVFYAAIPALLFRLFSRGLPEDGIQWSIVLGYYSAAFLHFALTVGVGRYVFRNPPVEYGLMAMSSTFSNTVLLGLPLVYTAFGEAGLIPIMMIVTFHPMTLIPIATIMIEALRGQPGQVEKQRVEQILLSTLKSLAVHPVILGLGAGLAFGATGLALPSMVDRLIDMLSKAATPAALCALGASLTQFRIAGDLKESMTLVGMKLALLPAMVFVSTAHIFENDPLYVAVATVNAATPAGINAFLLARYYGTYTQRSASVILLSTVLSVFTLALLIGWLKAG